MYQKNNSVIHVIVSLLVCCLLVAASYLIIVNKQYIIDQITVWQFKPTAETLSLVERAGMNDYGKFIYLASQPKLDGTQDFNVECNRVENVTSILGCYTEGRIYIYDVTDEQLDGIREVTAAHETLHAIYDRMSDDEKKRINALLEAEYSKIKNDSKLSELMDYYSKAEPGQRDNELHSLIGTEVSDISSELEVHYGKYFSDREKAVTLDEKYSGVFQRLEDRADELILQMNDLSTSISDRVTQYNVDAVALNIEITAFNKKAKSGDFSSQSDFNYERLLLVAKVAELNSTRNSINDDISMYNQLLSEYNSIASQSEKLNNSIDSTLAPAPSV